MTLLLKGKIFTKGRLLNGCILVENEKILDIGLDLKGEEILDFRRKGVVILPGFIDVHVHMRDFKLNYKEDFESGTMAAAMGGFTIVADMPNTIPPVNTPSMLKRREKIARKKSFVDYALYYGVSKNSKDLKKEITNLTIGLKIFMHKEFYSDELRRMTELSLEFAARENLLVVAHAERPEPIRQTEFGPIRLPEAEAEAISDISVLSQQMGFRLHITHLSSFAGAQVLKKVKESGRISADTCPHYLLLTEKDMRRIGGIARVEPPLRSETDRQFLLEMLRKGIVDAISSDHAPHSLEEKLSDNPAPGFPSLETVVPLVLTLVKKKELRFVDLVRACSIKPAKILGLKNVGLIEEGMLANFTVVDLEKRWKIDPSEFVSKAKFSPFAGMEVRGLPIATIVRGELVMIDREIVGEKGWGKNVKTVC